MRSAILLLGLSVLLPVCVHAQQAHSSEHHHEHHQDQGQATLVQPGQAAFAAIAEAVRVLEADPKTDWSKVDIDRLREHLVDMDEVFMRARADVQETQRGLLIRVTGSGRTLDAIRRMVPAHAEMMAHHHGWRSTTSAVDDGVVWSVEAASAAERTKLRALGFFGLLTLGSHHAPHHLAMARGQRLHR